MSQFMILQQINMIINCIFVWRECEQLISKQTYHVSFRYVNPASHNSIHIQFWHPQEDKKQPGKMCNSKKEKKKKKDNFIN